MALFIVKKNKATIKLQWRKGFFAKKTIEAHITSENEITFSYTKKVEGERWTVQMSGKIDSTFTSTYITTSKSGKNISGSASYHIPSRGVDLDENYFSD